MPYKDPEKQKAACHKHYLNNIAKFQERVTIRRNVSKKKAIEYLGGKCKKCGYNKCQAAFEFHHKDPTQKEFTINKIIWMKWEILKVELDKCELLCANCHREEHWYNE